MSFWRCQIRRLAARFVPLSSILTISILFLNGTINREYYVFSNFNVFVYNYYLFIYQHAGDAKNPYLAQYSAVVEDSPVITSWISMKIKILIKNIPKPLNTNFNTFLIEFFLASMDNILKDIEYYFI